MRSQTAREFRYDSARARALYESEGFVPKGTLRDAVKTPDGYGSLLVMSMLRDEIRSRQQHPRHCRTPESI